jgi:hypothetical protein
MHHNAHLGMHDGAFRKKEGQVSCGKKGAVLSQTLCLC